MDSRLEKLQQSRDLEIVDGEHTIIVCSNCSTELVDIWITKPDPNIKFKLKAKCAWCRDYSFDHVVEGKFHLGATDYCNVTSCVIDEGNENANVLESYIVSTAKNKSKKGKRKDNGSS